MRRESIVYSDFNSLRNEEADTRADIADEDYSFDSFDTGQLLTSEDGEKAMSLLLESEKKSEVSIAPMFLGNTQERSKS